MGSISALQTRLIQMEMPKDLTEVTLRRKDVYDGKILKVHVDDVRLPNGREAVREVVDHVDGAAVSP